MNIGELREICNLTVELVRLRQNECKHLCIESVAPEIFANLLRAKASAEETTVGPDIGTIRWLWHDGEKLP